VAVGGGHEQRLEVVEVDVERAQRHAGLGGDVAGGGPEVAPLVEGEQGLHDGRPGAGGAGQAAVLLPRL